MEIANRRLRFAELTSSLGAGVLGVGIGVLAAAYLRSIGIAVLVVGLLMHAWGMTDKHRLEANGNATAPWWSTVLYWVCWVALVGIVGVTIVRSLR